MLVRFVVYFFGGPESTWPIYFSVEIAELLNSFKNIKHRAGRSVLILFSILGSGLLESKILHIFLAGSASSYLNIFQADYFVVTLVCV